MNRGTLRGQAAIAGIGETTYYRHGQSPEPEFKLALRAVLAACADAGIDPREVDGFASYGAERSEASRLAAALGINELRFAALQWGGGGGGVAAAVGHAAAAVATGQAECVVVLRSLAQGQFQRYGQGSGTAKVDDETAFAAPYGVISPGQKYALKITRFMAEHGIRHEALRSIAQASYTHAQNNPRAVMHGRPLSEAAYDAARWIIEPFHRLYDCCMENDGAAALVVVGPERAKTLRQPACYLLGVASGAEHRIAASLHNAPDFAVANYTGVAQRLFRMAGVTPDQITAVQCYENFTGGVLMALVEHGLFPAAEANDVLRPENLLAPGGRLPLNTSGGNLAECYMHGLELVIEAVRQVRGTSCNQVPRHDLGLVIGGPMVWPASSLILGSAAAL